jgi:hypothetical protein
MFNTACEKAVLTIFYAQLFLFFGRFCQNVENWADQAIDQPRIVNLWRI